MKNGKQKKKIKMFNEETWTYDESAAMDAMYDLLLGNGTYDSILDRSRYLVVFPFDPTSPTDKDLAHMIRHYEEREEYERCAILKDYNL